MSSQFVFGGISIGSGDSGVSTPGVPVVWNADDNQQIAARIVPDRQTDDESSPFNFVAGSFDNTDSSFNFVVRMGHNVGGGGAQPDPTRPSLKDEYEQDYLTAGKRYVERHMVFTKPGGPDQRFLTFFGRWDGAPAVPADNSLAFFVDQMRQTDKTSVTEYWRCDETIGFRLQNLAPGLVVEMTDSGFGLSLSQTSSGTSDYLRLNRNFLNFSSINSFGEVYFGGSGRSGTGDQNSLLTVRGRNGTPLSLQIDDYNGNQRLSIDSTGTYTTLSSTTTYFNGSNLAVYTTGLLAQTFGVVAASGQIWTNQATASTATGAETGRIPFYNAAGSLVGYAKLYAAS